MPKTAIKSVAKTKKVTNKSTLKNRQFNLSSKKVQFFVVIFIFAVLGGGYFLVKSFGATIPYMYTAEANTLKCNGPGSPSSGQCYRFPDESNNNSHVLLFTQNTSNVSSSYSTLGGSTTNTATLYGSNVYRLCVFAKGKGQVGLNAWLAPSNNSTAFYTQFNNIRINISSTNYETYCTQAIKPPASVALSKPSVNAYTQIGPIAISQLYWELLSAAPSTSSSK